MGLGSHNKVLDELARSLLDLEGNLDSLVQEIRNLLEVSLLHTPRGQCRGTDTDTAGNESAGVTVDGVLVDGDVDQIADLLHLGASETLRPQVPENKVIVRAVGNRLVTVRRKTSGKSASVGANLLGVVLPLRAGNLFERDGDTGNDIVVRATLGRRENGLVDLFLKIRVLLALGSATEEDKTGTRATEGLVGGGGDDVAVLEGVVLLLGSNETANVCHVHHEVGAVLVGNLVGREERVLSEPRFGNSNTISLISEKQQFHLLGKSSVRF